MKMSLRFIVTIVAYIGLSTASSQDLSEVLFRNAGPKVSYIGQLADNGKDRNGTGMRRYKNGNLYIGDMMRGKASGHGMMVIGSKGRIDNAPGAVMYVGDWIDNKKEGRGCCYSANGDLIYEGNFIDDIPIDPYPATHPDQTKYFSDLETASGEYYIGQVTKGLPDGFGVFILTDGTLSIGKVKSGTRSGISMLLAGEHDWKSVKWNSNSAYTEISSTADYDRRREQYARHKLKSMKNCAKVLWIWRHRPYNLSAKSKLPATAATHIREIYRHLYHMVEISPERHHLNPHQLLKPNQKTMIVARHGLQPSAHIPTTKPNSFPMELEQQNQRATGGISAKRCGRCGRNGNSVAVRLQNPRTNKLIL